MQPHLAQVPVLEEPIVGPGVLIITAAAIAALLITVFVRRASRSAVLQRWWRWYNPTVALAWLVVCWLLARRLLAADSAIETAARTALLVALVALAAPLLRDILAAVTLSLEGRLRVGDDVRIDDCEGRITRLGLRTVSLRLHDGARCEIPNQRFASARIARMNLDSGEAPCEFDVTLESGSELSVAKSALLEAAMFSTYAAPGSKPSVLVIGTSEGCLRLRVRAFVFDRLYEDRYRSDILTRMATESRVKLSM